jgi:hypothetical protein
VRGCTRLSRGYLLDIVRDSQIEVFICGLPRRFGWDPPEEKQGERSPQGANTIHLLAQDCKEVVRDCPQGAARLRLEMTCLSINRQACLSNIIWGWKGVNLSPERLSNAPNLHHKSPRTLMAIQRASPRLTRCCPTGFSALMRRHQRLIMTRSFQY